MPQSLSIRWRPSEGVTIARAGERAVSIEVSEHIGTRRETPSPALADALMCLNGGADESVMLDALGDTVRWQVSRYGFVKSVNLARLFPGNKKNLYIWGS